MNVHSSRLWLLYLALATCCVSAAPSPVSKNRDARRSAPPQTPSPNVKHLKGRLIGFVSTDWVHAVFCVRGDSTEWFFVRDNVAAYFVAAHAGTELDLTVEAVSTDTLNAGEVFTAYGLSRASLNGYDSEAWWNNMEGALGSNRAYELFSALEDSLDVDEDMLPDCARLSK